MEKIEIVKELEEMATKIDKKYNRGGSFSPFRYYKYQDGKNIPVFFIGAPGLAVAISATLVTALLFFLVSLPFNLLYWIPFAIFVAVIMRLSIKIDKARQIRSFTANLIINGINALKEFNKTNNSEYFQKATTFFNEAAKWLEDEYLQRQITILKNYQNRLK